MLRLFRAICDRPEQAIVLVTHDAKVASHADRIVLMRDGEIVDEVQPRPSTVGPPGDLPDIVSDLLG